MIVNYEDVVKAIKDGMDEYTSSPQYKGFILWENMVCGMDRTLCILDDLKRGSSYSKALSGLGTDDLRNLKTCIDSKIRDIEKENKVRLYRLSVDDVLYYYSAPGMAKVGMLEKLNEWDDAYGEINVEINPIDVPESELFSYNVIQ
ncbi:hypothetical protein [Photobacterium kishitanii]|uniref:Uncharacterized protein n=1 Tax=Photobacterium kishitanii TaxID=318456 RepID=A0A2T3KML3_9GAMM|nr:hypothetical protein [Photobacterium kishitanii]PSV01024.1 hypothetical protein C9J27_03070 [Photobacterium kishitanii]